MGRLVNKNIFFAFAKRASLPYNKISAERQPVLLFHDLSRKMTGRFFSN